MVERLDSITVDTVRYNVTNKSEYGYCDCDGKDGHICLRGLFFLIMTNYTTGTDIRQEERLVTESRGYDPLILIIIPIVGI